MYIMNRGSNMLNLYCDTVCSYNVNVRLNVLVDGSWRIKDLESKVF